jgi:hypothetical protein
LEVATILRKRYELVVCEVVPSDEDSPDQVLRKIAIAGAQIMEPYLKPHDALAILFRLFPNTRLSGQTMIISRTPKKPWGKSTLTERTMSFWELAEI